MFFIVVGLTVGVAFVNNLSLWGATAVLLINKVCRAYKFEGGGK